MDEDPTPSAAPDPAGLDVRRRRILFRATRRGTKEADRLVGGFVTARIARFDEHELVSVEGILDLPDVDLADWLMGRRPVPPEHDTPMLRAIGDAARPARKI